MRYLPILALFAATPVWAECPTGSDLQTGIRIIESDGMVNIFTQKNDHLVEQIGTSTDGFVYLTMLVHGAHLLQLADIENGRVLPETIINTAYPTSAQDLPVPSAGARWDVSTVVRFSDGDMYQEQQTQIWGQPFEWQIGDCSFTTIEGKISYVSEDGTISEGVYFIPELGISFLHSYKDSYDDYSETFVPVSIEAVR